MSTFADKSIPAAISVFNAALNRYERISKSNSSIGVYDCLGCYTGLAGTTAWRITKDVHTREWKDPVIGNVRGAAVRTLLEKALGEARSRVALASGENEKGP